MKEKILIDVERQREKQKREKREKFARIYDKPKTIQFNPKKRLNMKKHFFMVKLTEEFCFWGSQNALIVYPVLCSRADFRQEEYFQLSRENIAKLAGISTVAVDDGLNVLERGDLVDHHSGIQTPFLQRKKVQDGKRRYWVYLPGFFRPEIEGLEIDKWRGNWFPFHTCIIDSGVWAKLNRKAKALYLAMRSVSYFHQELYYDLENVWVPDLDEVYRESMDEEADKELFNSRKWEFCDRPLTELFELARIPYSDTRELVGELEENGLVERLHDTKSVFQVWLRPNNIQKLHRQN